MRNTRWIRLGKHTTYVAMMILLYILQTTPRLFTVGGVSPILVIPLAIALAMFEGEFVGGLYGIFAGMLLDTSGFSLFGFNAIMLSLICVTVGLLVKSLMQPTLFSYLVYNFGAVMVIYSVQFLFNFGIWRIDALARLYAHKVIYVAVSTTLFSLPLYALFHWIIFRFRQSLDSYQRD